MNCSEGTFAPSLGLTTTGGQKRDTHTQRGINHL